METSNVKLNLVDWCYSSNVKGIKKYDFIMDKHRNRIAVEITSSPVKDERYLDTKIRLNRISSEREIYMCNEMVFMELPIQ